MNARLPIFLCLAVAVPIVAQEQGFPMSSTSRSAAPDTFDDLMNAQPKLLTISGTIDGSGKVVFTRQGVKYDHKHWGLPTKMIFGGEPWTDLSRTPPVWQETVPNLDLTRAWIVKRQGRDIIALESTPDGFDLFLSDSPNGGDEYQVTIAIPRRR